MGSEAVRLALLAVAMWASWAGSSLPPELEAVGAGATGRGAPVPGALLDCLHIGVVGDAAGESARGPDSLLLERDPALCRFASHVRVRLPGSGTGTDDAYALAVDFLAQAHKAGQRALVHCGGSRRRTVGVIALFELLVQRKSVDDVRADVKWLLPSDDDSAALLAFLDAHAPAVCTQLAKRGAISEAFMPPLLSTPHGAAGA